MIKNNTHSNAQADTIIIGAGISGLYLALRLSQQNKNIAGSNVGNIVVLEASDRIGGRIHTITRTLSNGEKVQYEAGAARFSKNRHKRVWKLLSDSGLIKHAKSIDSNNRDRNNGDDNGDDNGGIKTIGVAEKDIVNIHLIINKLDVGKVSKTRPITLLGLISEQMGKRVAKQVELNYPYYVELGQLAWWDAYQLFINDFTPSQQYYSLSGKGGLSQLPRWLYSKCKRHGVHIILNARVSKRSNNTVTLIDGKQWTAKKHIIYTCPTDAVALFDAEYGRKMLASILPTPLYRIYTGGYPSIQNNNDHTSSNNNKVWFSKLGKMNVAIPKETPLKFVIPINKSSPAKSTIMISYTDSKYAEAMYNYLDAGSNDDKLQSIVQRTFSKISPKYLKPSWVSHHYWTSGAGFWKPGTDSTQTIDKLIGPHSIYNKSNNDDDNASNDNDDTSNDNRDSTSTQLWIIGENVSHYQGWMEGALESADILLSKITKNDIDVNSDMSIRRISRNASKSSKTQKVRSGKPPRHRSISKTTQKGSGKNISKTELAKHNKRSDAWIAINGNVYDVTKWIDNHPGGDIILKGIGKDASKMFKNIRGGSGHPDFVIKKILPKYLIGKLK